MKKAEPGRQTVGRMVDFFKVMGDETRMRLLLCLYRNGEACVSELAEELAMTPSAVSHQLRVLKDADLIRGRREGKNIFYALDDEHVMEIIGTARTHVEHKHGF